MDDALLDAWQEAWSGRDPQAFASSCAPDVHYEDPFTSEPLVGCAELGSHAERLWAGFPDVRMETAGERLSGGDFVAAPVKLIGTHRGELGSLPPSGRFVVLHGIFYCQVEHGRLRRVRAFVDAYGAAVTLGVLPARGSLSERALLAVRGFGLRAGR